MSLIKREPSPAQAEASRANSLLSIDPRSARGKAISMLLHTHYPRQFHGDTTSMKP